VSVGTGKRTANANNKNGTMTKATARVIGKTRSPRDETAVIAADVS
jgi:hypothetical protein